MLVFKIRMVPQRIDNVPFKKRNVFKSLRWLEKSESKSEINKKDADRDPLVINNRADLYAYKKPARPGGVYSSKGEKLMKCKKKTVKEEMKVFGSNAIVFLWHNDLFSWKVIPSLSPGKHCIHWKVVYLDL